MRRAAEQPVIGQVPVSFDMFDPTRRQAVRIPSVIGGCTLQPAAE